MPAIFQPETKRRTTGKRSFWRGLLAAVLAHLLAFSAFVIAFSFLRPFVWLAVSSETYTPINTPLDNNSTEWLAIQLGGFLTWLITGIAASRWSSPDNKKWIYVLAAVVLLAPLFAPTLATDSLPRQAIWWLASPIGLMLGAYLHSIWELKRRTSTQDSLGGTRNDA